MEDSRDLILLIAQSSLCPLAMPFASKSLGQSLVDAKDGTIVSKLKVSQSKSKSKTSLKMSPKSFTSNLSQKIWEMKEGGTSIRKIAKEIGLSKSQVGRMVKSMA